ncbi:hypothetical protein BGP78_02580 [Pseudoalteromonas sp. MSK9-3]|uniref:hypothetical protein n=1 Tax=Pseudoalteromonas sp. MSK9-3 TaxID=1897633 RepID=UPI000E6CD9B8|nr:hypothetical protein [Pseudoalteromonas sp. MSK9-3]RJE75626.1 hypothetical protein BGP78_02580 [Pseudoalteromonas sp. MSK9-3]
MSIKQQYFIIRRQKTFWLMLSLVACLLALELSGVLEKLNAPIYHFLNAVQSEQNTNIVVIESANLQGEHNALIETIRSHSPKAIIVFSNTILNSTGDESDTVLYPHKQTKQCLPPVSSWVGYNIVFDNLSVNDCDNIWRIIFPSKQLPDKALVNFSLQPHALPKFESSRLLSGDILHAQIEDKIVFLTQHSHGYGMALKAPKLSRFQDPVYLHAYVAHSIEQNILVTLFDGWPSLSVQLGVILILVVLYQKFSINTDLAIASGLNIIWLVSAYLVLRYLYILIPVGQLITYTIVTLAWMFFAKKWVEEDDLQRIINNIHQRMLGRYLPKSFVEQSNPWDAIIELVKQQLDLDRSIFLARQEGDHRLYEIRAINCQLSNIHEMRRDYERAPYSDAIKQFGAVSITRPFFDNITEEETQYIVPLMYAGDIRGFWAMTVSASEHFNEAAFLKNVNRFANQIGELLFHYRIFSAEDSASNNVLTRTLTLNLEKPLSQKIKLSINEMEQKLSTLEHVFNQVGSATILFNLFGQVIQTNQALESLARQQGLAIFDMTALDLLSKVGQLEHDIAKGKLRYLTLHKGELYQPVVFGEQVYILAVRTLGASEIKNSAGDPFEVGGILFEFINISDLVGHLDDPSLLLSQLSTLTQQQEIQKQSEWISD